METPAGKAKPSKQTSVKNRRMNPPRPALQLRNGFEKTRKEE
jgi:hypothetical protein